jgi:hypothetical protein
MSVGPVQSSAPVVPQVSQPVARPVAEAPVAAVPTDKVSISGGDRDHDGDRR